jgi:CRP-like cAMP-binding protein
MGERERIIEHLRRVRSFADCSDDELLAINDLMTEVSIDAGETIVQQGEMGWDFLVITDGHATVEIDGQEVCGVMEGSFVGELALLGDGRRSATVTAVTPVRAYLLIWREFDELLERSPTLRAKIEQAAADRRG